MPYGNLLADVVQGSTANTPPVFKDGNGTAIGTLCRAWVNFNGTGTVAIRASFNVSSITDNGTGLYTVNFTNAMSDINYSVVGGVNTQAGGATMVCPNSSGSYSSFAPTTTACRITTTNQAAAVDCEYINVSFFR
jgi:hypothetical protein